MGLACRVTLIWRGMMNTASGLGVAALIVAILGAFTPIIGLYIGWAALVIACFSAFLGDKGLTIATVIVSSAVFFFLTPSLWINAQMAESPNARAVEAAGPAQAIVVITFVLLISPIVCMFFARRSPVKAD